MSPLTRVVCAALLAVPAAAVKANPKLPPQSNLAKHLEQIDHDLREKNVRTPEAVQDLVRSLPTQALHSLKLGVAQVKEVNASIWKGIHELHDEMVKPIHGTAQKYNLQREPPADVDRILFFSEPLQRHPQTAAGLYGWLEDVEQTSVAIKVAMKKVASEVKEMLEAGAVVHVHEPIPGMRAFAEFRFEEDEFRRQMLTAIQKAEWRAMQLVHEVEEHSIALATNSNFSMVTAEDAMHHFEGLYDYTESMEDEQVDVDNAAQEAKTELAALFEKLMANVRDANTKIARQLKVARRHDKTV